MREIVTTILYVVTAAVLSCNFIFLVLLLPQISSAVQCSHYDKFSLKYFKVAHIQKLLYLGSDFIALLRDTIKAF